MYNKTGRHIVLKDNIPPSAGNIISEIWDISLIWNLFWKYIPSSFLKNSACDWTCGRNLQDTVKLWRQEMKQLRIWTKSGAFAFPYLNICLNYMWAITFHSVEFFALSVSNSAKANQCLYYCNICLMIVWVKKHTKPQ